MQQILFTIKLSAIYESLPDIPVYGYGLMLFLAYLLCTALAKRLCKREGIDGKLMPDLAIWLFVSGILGGRINYVIQYWHTFSEPAQIIKLWDGGLVLYGALAGAILGYFGYAYFVLRKHNVSNWKMLDVIAPCVALGIALGRIGCLFTGCCFGNVACASWREIEFPLASPAADMMIKRGHQSPLGFVLKKGTLIVNGVEAGSAAAHAGLRAGDRILKVNDEDVLRADSIWPKDGEFTLTVRRDGADKVIAFVPTSIGVHPTQVYETISMSLLLFFLLSYFPYKRRDGELMVLFMAGYGVHRYLNEMLRTDTDPVWGTGLTFSQNISILVLLAAGVLAWFVWRRPLHAETTTPLPAT